MWLSEPLQLGSGILIGGIWIFHGCYSKIFNGIPRHRQIVARILGERWAPAATRLIGMLETCLGLWAISGEARIFCAAVQTLALLSMNLLEVWRARDLLISANGMLALNAFSLVLVWVWAL